MTYSLNHSFFSSFSEAQAYVLGHFYFRSHGRIQFSKHNLDILSIISSLLNYSGPIRIYEKIAELNISQKKFVNQLKDLGCVCNINTVADLPDLPPDLFRHFVRALFESYGRLYLVKHKYYNVNLTLEENFIHKLRSYLKIDTKHYYRYTHTNTIQMMITATPCAIKFCEWIYQDANYYGERKYLKYQDFLKKGV